MKLAIVGGGVLGLATAWNAARGGARVDLFEAASQIPNRLGASHDQHRLCRIPYGDLDGYARAMAPAMAAWERAWTAMGARHYAETGCLSLCTAQGDWTDRSRASLARCGIAHEILAPGAMAARWPMLKLGDARFGLWTEPGGVLFADAATAGFAALAAEAGAWLHPAARVTAIDPAGVVTVEGREIGFDVVLVAAGAWTADLLPWLDQDMTTLRQVVAYAQPPARHRDAWAAMPILLDMGGPRGMFCAPPVAGRGLKFGCGALNAPSRPGADPAVRAGEAEAVLGAWRSRLEGFEDYAVVDARVCWYAATPDQRFVATRRGRVMAMTGCSGHAYKLAALAGESLGAGLVGGDLSAMRWLGGDHEVTRDGE